MNVGIISLCPNISPLFEDEFIKPIMKIIKKEEVKVKVLDPYQVDSTTLQQFDKIILSGAPLGEFENEKKIERFSWLQEFEKPVLGICAGMHIIARLNGTKLKKSLEIGLSEILTLKENPLFSKTFQAYQLHSKTIITNEKYEVLAENQNGIQAIKHKEKPQYGVLFHPEVRNHEIILNFLKL